MRRLKGIRFVADGNDKRAGRLIRGHAGKVVPEFAEKLDVDLVVNILEV